MAKFQLHKTSTWEWTMAKCAKCGAETELLVDGVPLCLECDDENELKKSGSPAGVNRTEPSDSRRER